MTSPPAPAGATVLPGTGTFTLQQTLSLNDPEAVRGAAEQIREAGQKIDALQGKVELAHTAARTLPGSDTAKACERLDSDVKNLLKYQGRWPTETAGQIVNAVQQISHTDELNAAQLKKLSP
jgi:hypothetical protein